MLSILSQLQSDPVSTLIALLYRVPAVLIALTLHELAHGYVALRCGDPTAQMMGRLSFNPLRHLDPVGMAFMLLFGFGWARPVPVNPRNFKHFRRDDLLVSIAGVAMNLILFVLGFFLSYAVLAMALIFLFRGGLPGLFGTSEEVGNVICRAALFVMAALPFLGVTRLLSSYFYAMDEPRLAMVMAYADPAAATPVFVFLLPMLFDLDGVWLAYPAAQAALAAAALWMLRRYHRRVAV